MKRKLSFFGLVTMASLMLAGCGSNVKQIESKIELGSEVNFIDLVECKEGTTAKVKSQDGFNSMVVGDYNIPFEVTNEKGEKTEQTFTFKVVDTTAPEITTGDKVVLIKNVDFKIDEIITATDLSGDITITSSVEVDTAVSGDYPITVTVEDSSGNKTTKDITVTVMERTETNFRNAIWGDSPQMIISLETCEKTLEEEDFIVYADEIAGLSTSVMYSIDSKYGFHKGTYLVDKDYGWDGSSAISDYKTLKNQVVKKYGEPVRVKEPGIKSFMAEYSPDAGSALYMGYTFYQAEWEIPEKNTLIYIEASDSPYGIMLRVVYEDTRYEEDYSGAF